MSEAKKAVLMTMTLLGATNAERAAYGNVAHGKQAWDELIADGLIVKNEENLFVLSDTGRRAARKEFQ